MIQRLAPALLNDDSKEALLVIAKDRKKGPFFSNLEGQRGVKTILFSQLRSQTPNPADPNGSANPSVSTSADNPQVKYTKAEKDAVAKIKQVWLACSPRIKRRRSYISRPDCRAIARYFNMSAQCAETGKAGDRKAVRKLLLSHGVALSVRFDGAKTSLKKLQEATIACLENVEISQGVDQSLDAILGRNRDVEALLNQAEEKISDQCLVELVNQGVPPLLEEALKAVEDILAQVEHTLLETRKMLDAVSVSKESSTRLH